MKIKTKPARNKQADSLPLVRQIVDGIEEKKGSKIVCLSLKKISNSPCDYFVICEGTSRTHVQAIAGSVEEIVKNNKGGRPWHIEGSQNAEWILMDYIDVVVHIFQPQFREHYGLEDMWADAEIANLKSAKVAPVKKKAVAKKKAAPKKKALKAKTVKQTKKKSQVKKKPAKKKVKKK
mgnify:CR=1 FL=1